MRASRRTFVRGVLGSGIGAAVMGFDPVQRSWISTAAAKGKHGPDVASIPGLDGALFTDPDTRADYADDFGHVVSRMPIAVLQPGSISDVVKVIKFCCKHDIQVVARGQGHSTFGQAQVKGGVVIDMATLSDIEEIGSGYAVVQAGLKWSDLLAETVPGGQQPWVLTGYTGLSIGGTLSMGGIGAASFLHGAQVDNVLELEVVTGEGELKKCSRTRNQGLFNAVRGGIGQFGVIVRAKLPLRQVPPNARNYVIAYPSHQPFFADMQRLIDERKVDGVYGQVVRDENGGWIYTLLANKFYGDTPPVDDELLGNLSFPAAALQVMDMDTLSFDTFVDQQIAFLDSVGLGYQLKHIWGDVFLPGSKTATFVGREVQALNPEELGPAGFVLVFPVLNRTLQSRSAFQLPNERFAFLFDVLASGLPSDPDPAFTATQLENARSLFERARRQGGTLYPIGSTPMSRADWIKQYGIVAYALMLLAKRAFDPRTIMTPGPGVF